MTPGQIASFKAACAEYDGPTGQQKAVAVLATILAMPGLPEATWTVYPDRLSRGRAELHGQLEAQPIADLRAAIDAYFLALDLRLNEDRWMSGTDHCAAFTEVSTSGLVDGVTIKVWGAGR
jgi:hypothetical protein